MSVFVMNISQEKTDKVWRNSNLNHIYGMTRTTHCSDQMVQLTIRCSDEYDQEVKETLTTLLI